MNLELGRSVGSTEVSPFIGSREQVGETESACFSSPSLVPVGLARGPPSSLSTPRVDLTIPRRTNTGKPKSCPQSPNVRRSGALHS